jgi:hypothetical protein
MPGLVPGISRFCKRKSRHRERSGAIHFTAERMHGLLRCARNDVESSARRHLATFASRHHGSRIHAARNFFIIFVDGIFTTFIARLFTNTSDAIRENPAMPCVLHAGHAD